MEEHKKLYEEALVKEIMVSTALCIQELIKDDHTINEDEVCQFLEENYRSIIEETLSGDLDKMDETFDQKVEEEDDDDDDDENWKKDVE